MSKPISELYTVPYYIDRAAFEAANNGKQAPPWDRSRAIKRWQDPKASGPMAYGSYALGTDGKPKRITTTIPAAEAAAVNLPGRYRWQAYSEPTPQEHGASIAFLVNNTVQSIGGSYVALPVDAQRIFGEIIAHTGDSGFAVKEATAGGQLRYIYTTDYRVLHMTHTSGRLWIVGHLLKMRNANGMWRPGKWTFGAVDQVLSFAPELEETGEFDPRPEVPVPMREVPIEQIGVGFGGVLVLKDEADAPAAGDSTADIKAIRAMVERIAAVMGV